MHTKHVLVLNLLFEQSLKKSFDQRIAEVFETSDIKYDTIHLSHLDDGHNFNDYTHLLISGSTESAMEECSWYPRLDAIIDHFMSKNKSILGICFGHQFLVRHIIGKNHVRKSSTPEIGWTNIKLSDNQIFHTVDSLKSAVFHYDEVFDLDDRFEITATSDRCTIHGFQVRGEKIWGVQFHPDFTYNDVFEFTEDIRKKDPLFEEIHCRTDVSPDEFKQNDLILKNWIQLS
ncbi:type 1 glutamine amidotransferase [Maridesulfovibrio sp.]|uniref:type 1 glutamine amidotransferase n=1 Tax=Maridesulfovibrio sp. TaxID=2795000 RepID=UPI0039EEEE75